MGNADEMRNFDETCNSFLWLQDEELVTSLLFQSIREVPNVYHASISPAEADAYEH